MSTSILNAIFKGSMLPWQSKTVNTQRMVELNRKIELERDHFEEEMSPHEKARFDQYDCLVCERANVEIGSSEFELFMLGITVGIEIMEHKQSFTSD